MTTCFVAKCSFQPLALLWSKCFGEWKDHFSWKPDKSPQMIIWVAVAQVWNWKITAAVQLKRNKQTPVSHSSTLLEVNSSRLQWLLLENTPHSVTILSRAKVLKVSLLFCCSNFDLNFFSVIFIFIFKWDKKGLIENKCQVTQVILNRSLPQVRRLLQRTPSPQSMRPAWPWSGRRPQTRAAEGTSPTASTAGSAPVTARSAHHVGAVSILSPDSSACPPPPCWSLTCSRTPITASPLRARMECQT